MNIIANGAPTISPEGGSLSLKAEGGQQQSLQSVTDGGVSGSAQTRSKTRVRQFTWVTKAQKRPKTPVVWALHYRQHYQAVTAAACAFENDPREKDGEW